MCSSTLYTFVDTLLRALSTAVGFADGDYCEERKLLRSCVTLSFSDGRDTLEFADIEAGHAYYNLSDIRRVCLSSSVTEQSLNRCVRSYLAFCENSRNLDYVCEDAERTLGEMLYMTWTAERGLSMLKERLVDNLPNATEYVLDSAKGVWMPVRDAMQELMGHVAGLISRMWKAATCKVRPSDYEMEQRVADYNRSLDCALEVVETNCRDKFLTQMGAYDCVEEMADYWRERHIEEVDMANEFICFNPDGRKSARKMVAFISSYRDGEIAEDLDKYFMHAAFLKFLDEMVEEFGEEEEEVSGSKFQDSGREDEPTVLRDESGNHYHINHVDKLEVQQMNTGDNTFNGETHIGSYFNRIELEQRKKKG